MRRYLDTVILGLGIILLLFGGFLVWERHSPQTVVFADNSSAASPSNLPTRLRIPSLELVLPIYPATIVEQKWEITSSGISYLTTSPLPGELGNSVLYGHNWPNLLGNLRRVRPGDLLIVERGGETLEYVIHFVSVVEPTQTHVYANTADYRLTLYTCTGFLDRERLVVTAILR